MLFGTMYSGTLHELDGQSIQTKFVIIGVPLIPTGTIYRVTPNQGFPMGLSLKSIAVGYCRTTFFVISLLTLTIFKNIHLNTDINHLHYEYFKYVCKGMVVVGFIAWSPFFFDALKENKIRKILAKAIDYNMSPKYLRPDVVASIYMIALEKYKDKFYIEEWELEVETGKINDENKDILFTLAIYAFKLSPNDRYSNIYQIMCNFLEVKSND